MFLFLFLLFQVSSLLLSTPIDTRGCLTGCPCQRKASQSLVAFQLPVFSFCWYYIHILNLSQFLQNTNTTFVYLKLLSLEASPGISGYLPESSCGDPFPCPAVLPQAPALFIVTSPDHQNLIVYRIPLYIHISCVLTI